MQAAGDRCAKNAARAMETALCRSKDVPALGCLTEAPILGTLLNVKSAPNQKVSYSTGWVDHSSGKQPGC